MTGTWVGDKTYDVVFRCDNCTPKEITANLSGFGFDFVSVIFTAPTSGHVIVNGEATGPDCAPCDAEPGPAALIFLPVELVDFEARIVEKTVHLFWNTASELDNERFVVERSRNGVEFKPIGEIAGSGTTYEPKEYHFFDNDPAPGINYYRLKQMDFNGNSEYSPMASVFYRTVGEIAIHPTIVENELHVILPDVADDFPAFVSIHNSLGKLVYQKALEEGTFFSLQLPELVPGNYWVTALNGSLKKQCLIVKR